MFLLSSAVNDLCFTISLLLTIIFNLNDAESDYKLSISKLYEQFCVNKNFCWSKHYLQDLFTHKMYKEDGNSAQTWLGTSLSDLYRGQDPWSFTTTPVTPSRYHHVLFEYPVSLKEPPRPHFNTEPKHWDDDYVRMPYSPNSLFLVKQNNEEIIRPRWEVICEALLKPINSIEDLENAINCYNNKIPKFTALQRFFSEVLEEEESQHFFTQLLPNIIQLALQLPDIVPGSIPLLKKNSCKSVSFSQLQVACLLANAFLCTFIWRKDKANTYPGINFIRLFSSDDRVLSQSCVAEKLKCIIHYFRRVIEKPPVGVITFERKFIPRSHMPRWDNLDNNLGNTKIHISSSGTIEEGLGFLQVDFANKFIGGGVLGYGCVQEEIRFIICPELIISRLFTEELGDGEALIISGIERYSNYSGYAGTFKWDGDVIDETPFDNYGRRRTTIAVIDAIHFTKPKDQFHCSTMLRELNKAYVGFSSKEKNNLAPVATGNWGCGAFKGDPFLKSLIQLMACSAAGRDLVYYSFGNTELRDAFYKMHLFLASNKITISQVWRYLCRFCAANLPQDNLYSFIQQCHFDMKTQPTLKQFLCCNTQKRKTDPTSPSTSNNNEEIKSKKNANSFKLTKNEESRKEEVKNNKPTEKEAQEPQNSVPAEKIVQKNASPEKKESDGLVEKKVRTSVNSEEIINIFSLYDGTTKKTKESDGVEQTLLSEVHKMKKEKDCKGENFHEDSTVIQMEVDDVEDTTQNHVEDSKPSFMGDKKRKITDYFSKMTNHVNNYL